MSNSRGLRKDQTFDSGMNDELAKRDSKTGTKKKDTL